MLSIGTKLGDLERRNSPNLGEISPNSLDFWVHNVKVVEDTPMLSAAEAIYHLWRYWQVKKEKDRCLNYSRRPV